MDTEEYGHEETDRFAPEQGGRLLHTIYVKLRNVLLYISDTIIRLWTCCIHNVYPLSP